MAELLPGGKDRPFKYGGTGYFDLPGFEGQTFGYGTGGSGRGSVPFGSYPISTFYSRTPKGLTGWAVNTPDGRIQDPKYKTPRTSIMIHPDQLSTVNDIVTAGCIGISKADWPAFKAAMQKALKQYGSLAIEVAQDGTVAIKRAVDAVAGTFVSKDEFIKQNAPLKVGAPNDPQRVADLQKTLADAGFDIEVDGIFGKQTEAAVKQMQEGMNSRLGVAGLDPIDVDGKWGPASRAASIALGTTDVADLSPDARSERALAASKAKEALRSVSNEDMIAAASGKPATQAMFGGSPFLQRQKPTGLFAAGQPAAGARAASGLQGYVAPQRVGGVQTREPTASELDFFRTRPEVGGYAAPDNKVVLNPFSKLSPEQRASVAQNEAARIQMRMNGSPDVVLTAAQGEAFQGYGSPRDQRETVLARILANDPSAGRMTMEQYGAAKSLASQMGIEMGDRSRQPAIPIPRPAPRPVAAQQVTTPSPSRAPGVEALQRATVAAAARRAASPARGAQAASGLQGFTRPKPAPAPPSGVTGRGPGSIAPTFRYGTASRADSPNSALKQATVAAAARRAASPAVGARAASGLQGYSAPVSRPAVSAPAPVARPAYTSSQVVAGATGRGPGSVSPMDIRATSPNAVSLADSILATQTPKPVVDFNPPAVAASPVPVAAPAPLEVTVPVQPPRPMTARLMAPKPRANPYGGFNLKGLSNVGRVTMGSPSIAASASGGPSRSYITGTANGVKVTQAKTSKGGTSTFVQGGGAGGSRARMKARVEASKATGGNVW